ncbi:DUF6493 family protein [Kitasatospora sp. NPDC056184]|uniref:DUF6493 family protein n=1 Tax=Kitasatospora sp. NPDC056184 TaxID=3345738 RepID=UPI0035E37E33
MTDPTSGTISWDEVRALIAARLPQRTIDRLSPVPAAELRHLRTPLRKLRTELLRELSSGDRRRYSAAYDQLAALQFAGIFSAATPAEALDWLTARRLLSFTWPLPDGGSIGADPRALLAALLVPHRDPAFQRELADRLAAWLPARGDRFRWVIAHGLAVWSGAEVPATDGYLTGWVREGSLMRYDHREIGEWFADQGLRAPVPHHDTLLSWLRAEPRIAEFVRRLFEVPDAGSEFTDPYAARSGPDNEWPKALAALAGEGLLDRAELLDLCLGRLLRGDRPGNLRGFLRLYAELAPDAEEVAARARDHVRLAADGAATAAKAAQAALRSLDTRLSAELFTELTAGILARPEKALATAQLGWADAALRRDPAGADELLPALAVAFAHPAPAVQERALRLVARHLPDAADPAAVEAVRAAATGLGPALRSDAHRLLGAPPATAEPAVTVPPVPPVQSVPPVQTVRSGRAAALPAAPAGLFELTERLAAVLADVAPDPGEFEVVLAALVAEHHRDAAALGGALAPLASAHGENAVRLVGIGTVGGTLGCLLEALTGSEHRSAELTAELLALRDSLRTPALIAPLRVLEAALGVADAPVPVLLATPTAADGTLDPAVLTERLAAHRTAGARPWPADLAQALLRVPPHALPAVRAAATGLGCDLPPDIPPPAPRGFHVQAPDGSPTEVPRIAPIFPAPAVSEGVTGLLHALPDPTAADWFKAAFRMSAGQLAQLPWTAPWHPEAVAAHGLPGLVLQAGDPGLRDPASLLPRLAELPAEPGPVSHLLLAYGLTAARPEHRTAALDALLALTARGSLRPEVLGEWLAGLWRLSVAKPNRVLPVLADAARSGAGRPVFAVLTAMLTDLAPDPARRGLPDALTLAADCAAAEGIRTPVPALAAFTVPTASRRVRAEAVRLAGVLAS